MMIVSMESEVKQGPFLWIEKVAKFLRCELSDKVNQVEHTWKVLGTGSRGKCTGR